jgi:DNA-binding transcriptional MerR regulator
MEPEIIAPKPPRGPRPLWERCSLFFNQHVVDYRNHLVSLSVNPVKIYLHQRASELGFTAAQLTGRNRTKRVSNARHLVMFEIHKRFKKSTVEIGRIFGGRDHTSVQFALIKHGHRVRKQKGLSLKQIERIKRLTEKGFSAHKLAEQFGVSLTTIRNHTVEGYKETNARRNALLREKRAIIKAQREKERA